MATLDVQPFVEKLLGDTDAPALIGSGEVISHVELGDRVREFAERLNLPTRSVVVLSGGRTTEWVVAYLALFQAGHIPLLAGDRDHQRRQLVDTWSPAAVIEVGCDGTEIERHNDAAPVEIHPDLALLLSTSGSTGQPKLVRLSHENLASNASAIVGYLGLTAEDRGITSLPLHYCYGLSVLHSHLMVGASVVLTEASVVDPCFRAALEQHRVTNVAGVPHTFELLERVDADHLNVPSLRFVTQAGGRLAPEAVRRWVARTHGWGAEFFVMYGQTEATARMAYLPPDLADRRPETIGVAIPGGELFLRSSHDNEHDDGNERDDSDERANGDGPDGFAGVGELVYRGANVMLGYAQRPADLALGRTIDELATGDLARFHPEDGVFEIVGRRSRFVKPFGLRIDLDLLEQSLADTILSTGMAPNGRTGDVAVTGDDNALVVLVPGADPTDVRHAVAAQTGLPARCVHVAADAEPPRTRSGKIDYGALMAGALVDRATTTPAAGTDASSPHDRTATAAFAAVLGRNDITAADTFVSLGGDSLSYVECSIRLERVLDRVPSDWHLRPVGELEFAASPSSTATSSKTASPAARWWHPARLDTTVVLRAVAIGLIVATHMRLWFFPGGAHLLLAVVGYNLSRFMMPIESARDRVRAGLRTAARAAIPAVAWVGAGMAFAGAYSVGTLLLVNNYVGPASHRGEHWHFWFIEVFVHVVVLATVAFAIPAVWRADRRHPYLFPLAALGLLLLLRLEWAQMNDWYNIRFRTHTVAWFVALGWLVHRSDTALRRTVTSALCFVVVLGFFDYPPREWFIAGSLVALVWLRTVPVPRIAVRPFGIVASASLWIYISHFTIWPPLLDTLDKPLAFVATVASGVAIWAVVDRLTLLARRAWHQRRSRPADIAAAAQPAAP